MPEIYNFSPSLEEQVQLCIAETRNGQPNKWMKKFGHLKFDFCTKHEPEAFINLCNTPENSENFNSANKEVDKHQSGDKCKESNNLVVKNIEEMVDSLETEFFSYIDLTIAKCSENHTFLIPLAQRLSTPTVQKLCTYIYDKKDINNYFISNFFEYFLPAYIKREYNSCTLELLMRGNKEYPVHCKMLLQMLVKDVDVPAKVLQDYVLVLTETERTSLLLTIAEIDLSTEEFISNLFSIYTAYKDCVKSKQIQIYIQAILSQHSRSCALDRNYGKLFLAFLQTQKYMNINVDYDILDSILDIHRSPFKRPCFTLIKELRGGNNDDKSSSEEDSY